VEITAICLQSPKVPPTTTLTLNNPQIRLQARKVPPPTILTLNNPQIQSRREEGEQGVEQVAEQAVKEGVEEGVDQAVEQAVEQVVEAVEAEEAVEEVVELQRRQTFKLNPRLADALPGPQWWWLHPHASLERKSVRLGPRHPMSWSVQKHRKCAV
jgi:hypothetical protein